MREGINDAMWGPRWFLIVIIILLGLPGMIIAITTDQLPFEFVILALLPFVVPFILSFFYPVVAGWILILEVAVVLIWSKFHPWSVLIGSIPCSIGIWMIINYYKAIKGVKDQEDWPMTDQRTWEN